MGYKGLNNFDQVAKRYEEIKPIKGARASYDLRPVGERRYWWNRIMKVNDNKFVLLDGHYSGSWTKPNNNPAMQEQTCPILWERREDGDYITIRSHMNGGISVSRYTFLDKYLPIGMSFDWYNETGKHYVIERSVGLGTPYEKKHYLPKFTGNMDWSSNTFEMINDNKIVFKIETDAQNNNIYVRANELQPYVTRRIDKDLDKRYVGKVTELWTWAKDMLPILGTTLTSERYEYSNKLTGAHFWYWTKQIKQAELCEILDDPEHEKRLALAVCLANEVGAYDNTNRFVEKADSLYQVKKAIRKAGKFFVVEPR